MKTIKIQVFQFDELDDFAKIAAREWFKEGYPDHAWWDAVYDDARSAARFFGISIDQINFSGFWYQGDGACFTGTFRSDDLKALSELKENYPTEEKLHALLQRLLSLTRPENSIVKITAEGRYSHSHTMRFDDLDDGYATDDFEELVSCFRSFADWIYAQLEKEYEYLVSDECVDEQIRANGYWFLGSGERYSLGDD